MVQPLLIVDGPAIQPYRYGLESVAVPAPTPEHWEMGVEYEQIATYLPGVWPGTCFDGEASSEGLPGNAPIVQGLPFSVYAGVSCPIVGYTEEYILARARAILKLGWQNGAEQALWSGLGSSAPALTSASIIPGATGVSLVAGIAALEDYLGKNYLGTGVIHVPRKGAAYLSNAHIAERGNQLQTLLGTQFVFGGGYPNTNPTAAGGGSAAANTLWMIATGMITARRDDPFIPGGVGQAFNRTTNIQNVIAEQVTVLTVDGPIVAVSVDLTKADNG